MQYYKGLYNSGSPADGTINTNRDYIIAGRQNTRATERPRWATRQTKAPDGILKVYCYGSFCFCSAWYTYVPVILGNRNPVDYLGLIVHIVCLLFI